MGALYYFLIQISFDFIVYYLIQKILLFLQSFSEIFPVRHSVAVVTMISLCLFMNTAIATGSTYYVSTSGSDSNPGTLSQPWKTIQKAANTVTQGDTVNIRGGTYREKITFTDG